MSTRKNNFHAGYWSVHYGETKAEVIELAERVEGSAYLVKGSGKKEIWKKIF